MILRPPRATRTNHSSPTRRSSVRIAQHYLPPFDHAEYALAGRRVKIGHVGNRDIPVLRRLDDGGCQRMLGRALHASRKAQHIVLAESPRCDDRRDGWLAFGQRSGFIDNKGVDLFHALQRDRKSVVWGKSVSVRVELGGGRVHKKKK